MKELGVTDHRFLGGPGRFGDSGMMGLEQNHRAGAFWSADVDEAAEYLVDVIREVRPRCSSPTTPTGLRTPGPHPGPPRGRARRRAGRGRRRPPRPRRALGDHQGLLEPRPALRRRGGLPAAARGPARTALRALRRRGGRTRRGRRHGGHHRDRRDRVRRREGRRHAGARHPDRGGRTLVRAVERTRATAVHHRVLRVGARGARGTRS